MFIMRVSIYFAVAFLMVALPFPMTWGHEVVGEVTPLMLHSNHTLTFIKKGRGDRAMQMAKEVFEDFEPLTGQRKEAGLKTNSERVDRLFGTTSRQFLTRSIMGQDLNRLKKALEFLSFLLMLEKFDVLQNNFDNKDIQLNSQLTIFWLGRNYFSYLLEPTMGEEDPVEEKRLDRLLDQMLYSLEDQEWERFLELREALTWTIVRFFDFPIPTENFNALK